METINLNKASAKDLEKIIHVGPKIAQKIIVKRPYKDIYELSSIPGIGAKRMVAIERQGLVGI